MEFAMDLLITFFEMIGRFFRGARRLWNETEPREKAPVSLYATYPGEKLQPASKPAPKSQDGQ